MAGHPCPYLTPRELKGAYAGVTIIKPHSYNMKSTNVRWRVSRYHELFSSSSSVSTVTFREGFGEDLRPGDVSLEGTGEVVGSKYDLTERSSTPRTRLHAIDHTPTLTEPVPGCQRKVKELRRICVPLGANGNDSHHVSGPSQLSGK